MAAVHMPPISCAYPLVLGAVVIAVAVGECVFLFYQPGVRQPKAHYTACWFLISCAQIVRSDSPLSLSALCALLCVVHSDAPFLLGYQQLE
jgi:hypothetical protein